MPLGAMMKSTLLIGVKSMTRIATGEWKPSYDYSSATPIKCRFYDVSLKPRQRKFGNTLEIDGKAKLPIGTDISPLALGSNSGARHQVQIDDVVYEVLWVRSPGNVGRYLEILVKAWK